MPRVDASNGIRPEIRALAVLQLGKTVTPAEIDAHVGTGEYSAKYVSFLNTRYGFTITANKDGRKVVSYTVVAEPANAARLRAATADLKIVVVRKNGQILCEIDEGKSAKASAPKAPKVKAVKAPKAAKVVKIAAPKKSVKDLEAIKAANLATLKKVAAAKKKVKVRDFDDVTEQFGSSGEVGTSFSVEKDWDAIDFNNFNLKALGI